jgi:hypothetical protein
MRLGPTHRVAEKRCMRCEKVLDSATPADSKDRPARGDVSVCIQCGHIAIFTRGGKLREPTPDELRSIMADRRVKTLRNAVSLLHVRGKPN